MKKLILEIVFLIAIIICVIVFNTKQQTIGLVYTTNGGVPYQWQYVIEDGSIVQFVKSYEIKNDNKNGMTGAPISTKYIFKGVKKGSTNITFKYVNIVDNSVTTEEKTKVKVDKNHKIKIIK